MLRAIFWNVEIRYFGGVETVSWVVETIFEVLRPFLGVETNFEGFETLFMGNGSSWGLFLGSTGGCAWPFFIGELICLFHSFNDRDFSLQIVSSEILI